MTPTAAPDQIEELARCYTRAALDELMRTEFPGSGVHKKLTAKSSAIGPDRCPSCRRKGVRLHSGIASGMGRRTQTRFPPDDRQVLEKNPRIDQIGGPEALCKSSMHRSEQVARLLSAVLAVPQTRKAHRGSQFP